MTTLSGPTVRSLMRKHKKTIAGLARQYDLTQRRVREVRAKGVTGVLAAEWTFLITGVWPDSPRSP